MRQASEDIASQYALSASNKSAWGSIIINVKVLGAKGDGVTDDTAAIKKAVALAVAIGGGTVYLPAGKYKVTSTIVISKGVHIVGDGKSDDNINPNGTGIGVTTISWSGPAGGTMFQFKSSFASSYLFGGGIEDCVLNGNEVAGTLIHCASLSYGRFRSIEVRQATNQAILLDSSNGVLSQFNTFEDVKFVNGVSASTADANGIVMKGDATAGVTQNHIISLTGLVWNGALLKMYWSDNNVIEKLFGSAGNTGVTLYLANGVGGNAAYNVIKYMTGKVKAESQTVGNRILHLISEGSGVSCDAGAQLHYVVDDYVNAALYQTNYYLMSDKLDIRVGDFSITDGSAATGMAAAQWACLNLPDTWGRIGCMVPAPVHWYKGTIKTLRLWFTTDTANTSKKWRCNLYMSMVQIGSSLATPEFSTSVDVTVPDSPYVNWYVDIPINQIFNENDAIYISIQREGGHVNDTAAGNVQILGANLFYQSTGPDTPGSGTYDVTPMRK